jgi:hypothetical protein
MSQLQTLLSTLPPLSIPSTSPPPDTFTLFPKLAPELRNAIWALACLSPLKVSLISTLSDPSSNMISTISGQSRQPAIMEVSRESRAVGTTFYRLVETIPKQRFFKRGEGACPRCIYNTWNSAQGRRFIWWYFEDEEINLLPEEIRTVVAEADGFIPPHKPTTDAKGDMHWINFAVDEFVLKLSGKERLTFEVELEARDFLNFKKKDVEEIKWLSCMLGRDFRAVKILMRWTELEECLVRMLEQHESKYEERVGMGEVGVEIWRKGREVHVRGNLETLLRAKRVAMPKMRYEWVIR